MFVMLHTHFMPQAVMRSVWAYSTPPVTQLRCAVADQYRWDDDATESPAGFGRCESSPRWSTPTAGMAGG